jgi:hypothetical protein
MYTGHFRSFLCSDTSDLPLGVGLFSMKVYPKVSGLNHNEIYAYNNKHSLRNNTKRAMAAKLTRLTHKMAIQLHLVAESHTICSSRSRQPVRKILDIPLYCTKYIGSMVVTCADTVLRCEQRSVKTITKFHMLLGKMPHIITC